jgi:hypothetical protein
MELYEASKETCIRLYVANGGSSRDIWHIRPYPGTAAIASQVIEHGKREWTLCMPAFPLDVRLPRWQADLIGGYTVHELLHALWTDFAVAEQAKREGIHSLLNSVEDNRIEFKASSLGELKQVSEARRLLQALNAYICERDTNKPGFTFDNPNNFAFVLNLAIFHEKHHYVSCFPADWRRRVAPHMLPLFDLALREFDGFKSTADALALARRLAKMAQALLPAGKGAGKGAKGDDEAGAGKGKAEGDEAEGDEAEGDEAEGDEAEGDEAGAGKGAKGDDEAEGDEAEGAEAEGAKGEGAGKGEAEAEGAEGEGASKGEDKGEGAGKGEGRLGGMTDSDTIAVALDDIAQAYGEASLAELGMPQPDDGSLAANVALNAPKAKQVAVIGLSFDTPAIVTAQIASPAKLKRHLTMAVKAPERVGRERYQSSGRLDMRNLAGIATRADTVYRRRTEDEAREAVVSILLDMSGSMNSHRRSIAAKAMAMHMGDALKAAGVKFEIVSFSTGGGPIVSVSKPVNKGWNDEAKVKVAHMSGHAGTAMLPAISFCAQRLLDVGNVTRRILLVLTDGEDHYSPAANALNCNSWRRKGVEIAGIGLMLDNPDTCRQAFGGQCIMVPDVRSLSAQGIAELTRILDKGAPRAV